MYKKQTTFLSKTAPLRKSSSVIAI